MRWNGPSGVSGRNGLPILSTAKPFFSDDICFERVCSVCLIVLISGIVFVMHWLLFLGVSLYILINTRYFYTICHVGFELNGGRQPYPPNAMIVWLENNIWKYCTQEEKKTKLVQLALKWLKDRWIIITTYIRF